MYRRIFGCFFSHLRFLDVGCLRCGLHWWVHVVYGLLLHWLLLHRLLLHGLLHHRLLLVLHGLLLVLHRLLLYLHNNLLLVLLRPADLLRLPHFPRPSIPGCADTTAHTGCNAQADQDSRDNRDAEEEGEGSADQLLIVAAGLLLKHVTLVARDFIGTIARRALAVRAVADRVTDVVEVARALAEAQLPSSGECGFGRDACNVLC